jgi:hypothetical protein
MVEENLCSEESPKEKKIFLKPAIIKSSYKKISCHSGM